MTEATEACPLPLGAEAPDDATLTEILAQASSVAVVGVSPRAERTSHAIAQWLIKNSPYEVYLVNPTIAGEEILGRTVYASLADLPVVPDIVDVFRASHHVEPVALDAIAVGARVLWMQLGVMNDAAASAASAAGLSVIQNRCLKVELARLRPSGSAPARDAPRSEHDYS